MAPELFNREILKTHKAIMKKAIRYFTRREKRWEKVQEETGEEMRAWGAPVEDFPEQTEYWPYRKAYTETVKKYPVAKLYIMLPARTAGQDTVYGKRDFYGGL